MAEQDKPFVVNDRRKFRMDGELREPAPEKPAEATDTGENTTGQPVPTFRAQESSTTEKAGESGKLISFADAAAQHEQTHPHTERPRNTEHASEPIPFHSHSVTPEPEADENAPVAAEMASGEEEALPPPPTPEEVEQVKRAYDSTAERLDTVMRATNPGAEHLPPMDFTRLVQSVYMSAMMQMGAGTPQGEQARVDLMGAKQSIDMLNVIAEKAGTNLTEREQLLIDSALFELRMGFLEITQMLARQAAARQGAPGMPGGPGFGGPGAPGGGPRIVT